MYLYKFMIYLGQALQYAHYSPASVKSSISAVHSLRQLATLQRKGNTWQATLRRKLTTPSQ